jgi:hypothetical protein
MLQEKLQLQQFECKPELQKASLQDPTSQQQQLQQQQLQRKSPGWHK